MLQPLTFLDSLGMGFSLAFLGLTAAALFQYLRAHELATEGRREALGTASVRNAVALEQSWCQLSNLKSELAAASSRASLITSSIPTLALLGTCVGFFFAILNTGQLELGADPQETLMALMDGGVGTALATTVCGQGIYLLLGQVWALFVAGPRAEATTLLDEGLGLLRARLALPDPAALEAPPLPRIVER